MYTVYSVRRICILYNVQYILYNVRCTVCIVQHIVYTVLFIIHCTIYTVQCTVHTVQCTLYTLFSYDIRLGVFWRCSLTLWDQTHDTTTYSVRHTAYGVTAKSGVRRGVEVTPWHLTPATLSRFPFIIVSSILLRNTKLTWRALG